MMTNAPLLTSPVKPVAKVLPSPDTEKRIKEWQVADIEKWLTNYKLNQ